MEDLKYDLKDLSGLGIDLPAREVFATIYEELRTVAHGWFSEIPDGHTLQPTAVVHEAFLRLARKDADYWKSTAHLRAVAARAMRQVLADYARRKRSLKRGVTFHRITLVNAEPTGNAPLETAPLAFDESLTTLARLNARQAAIVEMRFLGDLSCEDIAQLMGLSKRTVELDWKMARAWLANDLRAKSNQQ